VAGGCIASGVCTDKAQLFDPQTNTWAPAADLPVDLSWHTATLLYDGRVLLAGGGSVQAGLTAGLAFLYDPLADAWSQAGAMLGAHNIGRAVRLLDGRVLLAGNYTAVTGGQEPANSAAVEIYNPATNTWRAVAGLAASRRGFVLELLPDGQILAVGGAAEIERYDLQADRWRVVGLLPQSAAFAAAVLLPDGVTWLAGGEAGSQTLANTYLVFP
jgi:N-acetylneuraminic acid mutarotase